MLVQPVSFRGYLSIEAGAGVYDRLGEKENLSGSKT